MLPRQKLTAWSNIDSASRIPPSAFCAITFRASGSYVTPSLSATSARCFVVSSTLMRLKSYIWHRDSMVGRIFCFSVVARMKTAWRGGSSRVFRKALNAAEESMCTSSMIYTLYFPICGGILTWSTSWRMSSTELFDAASSSCMLSERPSLNARHDSHSSHAEPSGRGSRQLMVFAKMRAHVVFPTPLGPQNRYACASLPVAMAFLSVVVNAPCPMTELKFVGRYFLADTM